MSGLFALMLQGVVVTPAGWNGWPDAIQISNGEISAVVVPSIGRIMAYQRPSKPNLLWVNEKVGFAQRKQSGYRDFGGDKVWATGSAESKSSFDPKIDGSPWKIEIIPNGVRLTSELGSKWPVKIVREITLKSFGTELKCLNKLSNWGPDREFALGQSTQVRNSNEIRLAANMSSPYRILKGAKLNPKHHVYDATWLRINGPSTREYRFGTRSGSIWTNVEGEWIQSSSAIVKKQNYPEGNNAQVVSTLPGVGRANELIHYGPLGRIGGREIVTQVVTWQLVKTPQSP